MRTQYIRRFVRKQLGLDPRTVVDVQGEHISLYALACLIHKRLKIVPGWQQGNRLGIVR
jgi:hypothetical protein